MRADPPFTAASAGPTALSPELGYFPRMIARGRPDRVGGGSSSSMGCVFESLSSVDVLVLRSGVPSVRFDVVGEHRPAGPGALALATFEAAAPEPVAAFGVRDPALGADAIAGEPVPPPLDEHAVGDARHAGGENAEKDPKEHGAILRWA